MLSEVFADAGLGDAPLRGRTHTGTSKLPLMDKVHHFVDSDIEKFGNLSRRDKTLGCVGVRHIPIIDLSGHGGANTGQAVDNLSRTLSQRATMTAMTSRTHRAVWADARFLIGLALVVASIAGVWWVVHASRATTPVAVADVALLPGETIEKADIRWVEVTLGDVSDAYLTVLPDEATVTRPLAAGELVPAGAVIERERSDVTTVVIVSPTDVASTLAVGSTVEVWVSPVKDRVYGEARVLIESATIAAIRESTGLASGGTVTLEIVVDRDHVAAVFDAQSSKSALWVVPLGGVR